MIKQNNLSSECWLIQFQEISACKNCEAMGTKECGGKSILKKMKNKKGIPIGEKRTLSNEPRRN